jgi:hypothetical protein
MADDAAAAVQSASVRSEGAAKDANGEKWKTDTKLKCRVSVMAP